MVLNKYKINNNNIYKFIKYYILKLKPCKYVTFKTRGQSIKITTVKKTSGEFTFNRNIYQDHIYSLVLYLYLAYVVGTKIYH